MCKLPWLRMVFSRTHSLDSNVDLKMALFQIYESKSKVCTIVAGERHLMKIDVKAAQVIILLFNLLEIALESLIPSKKR